MSTLRKNVTISVEEYLEGEKWGDRKHEYVAGQLYAMVGVSEPHGLITGNIFAALHQHLRGGPCRVFASDLKVRVADNFYYPDLFVTCDPADDHPYFKIHPRLIIEVLSPRTEARDTLEKRGLPIPRKPRGICAGATGQSRSASLPPRCRGLGARKLRRGRSYRIPLGRIGPSDRVGL